MFSFSALLIVAAFVLLWRLVLHFSWRSKLQGLKPLPGPSGYPLIGSLLDIPKTFHYHKFTEWAKVYGPIYKVEIAGTTHVVVSDEDIASDLLALRGAQYSDRHPAIMGFELVSKSGNLGGAPFNKYWRNARKFAAATLSTKTLDSWSPVLVAQASRLIYDLVMDSNNYEYLFERYSASVALRVLYNKHISGPDEPKHVEKITTIVRTLERTAAPGAFLVDFIPALKYLPTWVAPFKAEAEKLHAFEYNYFHGLVVEGEESFAAEKEKAKEPRALIQAYADDKNVWDLSDFEITYTMGTLLEGGTGTTSSAMQTYCLAMWHYPEWQDKVQEELDRVVGSDRIPSFDDWPNLPTVRAAMKETLRWRPVVPGGIPHRNMKDDNYNGYFIPKGAVIHANQYAMFKNEAVYVDAESFNPDRWLDPKYTTYQGPLTQYPNLKRFPGFGVGRRICPGLGLAERSMFIEISTLMWACSVGKKLDENGAVIPVPWYSYKPGANTVPYRFDFTLKARDEKRLQLLREANSRS